MPKIILATLYLLLIACSITPTAKNSDFVIAEINAKLALAYLEKNDLAQGKAKLLLAQKQAPIDPTIWYVSGYFLERSGDKNAANQAYVKAIQLAPQLGAAQNNYGAFLCRNKQYSQAISHFLLAVKDPSYINTAAAYKNAALCALQIPDTALAKKYFDLSSPPQQ
jgi:type IV pilus assembly protein PilF